VLKIVCFSETMASSDESRRRQKPKECRQRENESEENTECECRMASEWVVWYDVVNSVMNSQIWGGGASCYIASQVCLHCFL
jgi:hypothetical protein